MAALAGPVVDVVAELSAVRARSGSCADTAVAEVVAALTDAGPPAAALSDDGDAIPAVAIVPASLVKGLEFDAVVVVDPAAIVAAEPRGLHRLYVVLTRAVSTSWSSTAGTFRHRSRSDPIYHVRPSRWVTRRLRTARGAGSRSISVEVMAATRREGLRDHRVRTIRTLFVLALTVVVAGALLAGLLVPWVGGPALMAQQSTSLLGDPRSS